MAMITCPNCGGKISDKAKKCVHCGTVFIPEEKKYCQDCGAELEEDMKICPQCGCPVDDENAEIAPQQVEVTGVKIAKKSKKIMIIAAIIIVITGIAAATGMRMYKKNMAAKEAAENSGDYNCDYRNCSCNRNAHVQKEYGSERSGRSSKAE